MLPHKQTKNKMYDVPKDASILKLPGKHKAPLPYVTRFAQPDIVKTQVASRIENFLVNTLTEIYIEYKRPTATIFITTKDISNALSMAQQQANKALLELEEAKVIVERTREKITLNSNYYWAGTFDAWKNNNIK